MKKNWFFETDNVVSDLRVGYRIKRKIFSKKTEFQQIDICQTDKFGKILFLDGLTQASERDEFIYHEMMTQVALMIHGSAKKILIIGGGDGGILREVLKHKIEEAYLVEIDNEVIEASQKYLSTISKNSFNDKRVKVYIENGFNFVKQYANYFDVILVDSSDPIGPAKELFSSQFYKNVFKALKKDGIAVFQSGLTILQKKELKSVYEKNKKIFPIVKVYYASVPTYLVGDLGLILASKKIDPTRISKKTLDKNYKKLNLGTKYYNPEIHFAAFVLPNYLKDALR
jgi:spermidine synthase